ncbi:MAG: hypothetical protein R3E95_11295 [Thiolinea sp.]
MIYNDFMQPTEDKDMGHAYIDAKKLHEEIDSLSPVDMAKVVDFVGYLKSQSVKRPVHDETEEERQAAITQAIEVVASDVASRFGDPMEWQREVRKDRPLPGRN